MTLPQPQAPYAYRDDPNVPEFDDTRPVVVMDGECVLCSFGARLIARFDRRGEFRICRMQTPLGRALLRHYGLREDDPESWLYLVEGRAYTAVDAMLRAGQRMGGVGHVLWPLRLVPRPLQNRLYLWLACHRYRLFGRTDLCSLPDPALRARLME